MIIIFGHFNLSADEESVILILYAAGLRQCIQPGCPLLAHYNISRDQKNPQALEIPNVV